MWQQKAPQRKAVRGFLVFVGHYWELRWSPRQESNLHLALRRHLFYPLNYGEMDIFNGWIEV